jgi:hypothetical protein
VSLGACKDWNSSIQVSANGICTYWQNHGFFALFQPHIVDAGTFTQPLLLEQAPWQLLWVQPLPLCCPMRMSCVSLLLHQAFWSQVLGPSTCAALTSQPALERQHGSSAFAHRWGRVRPMSQLKLCLIFLSTVCQSNICALSAQ